tara:strand:- start:9 stop:188 length:180 start_codon:yes stop_codon:yes gene_type:complete
MKRLTVDMDDDLHTSFKAACVFLNNRNKKLNIKKNVTMNGEITTLIRSWLEEYNENNAI